MLNVQSYSVENFLDSICDLSFLRSRGIEIKNDYPELPYLISKYKKRITEASKTPSLEGLKVPRNGEVLSELLNTKSPQYFEQIIILPVGDDYYTVCWSVQKAKEVIKRHNIQLINFITKVVADGVPPGAVNTAYLEQALINNEPVIVIKYPLFSTRTQFIVIDGNHRIISRLQNGDKYVKGYLIDSELQNEALAGELDRILYVVHYNICAIINYVIGDITKSQLKRGLLPV
ncbi:hypothetical protein [Bacillus sp. Cr_A10]|uniref:hypothetical protein n=1 Tax=Bacillus sp. Cr_A10 TaxID=3033993 RepID=UPI0023DC7E71|nr:hypothetical protein [Bacillus sp. Cr_A10]MDF2064948.1 hypothetical protein [Bacillus sp. Cr_A10]